MTTPIRCLHVASGDLWAGAEVQLFTLLSQLVKNPEAQPHVALMNAGELATRLTQAGVPVTVLDEHRHAAPALLLKLKSLAANVRPHVIHTHRQKENVLGGIISLLGKRIPSIRTVHGSSEHTPRGLISLPKRLNCAADYACGRWIQSKMIAVSHSLAAELRARFGENRVVVIENGIDIDVVRATPLAADVREGRPEHIHVGIVGRLEPVKRVDLFLEVARELLTRDPKRRWLFHVIGSGSLLPDLFNIARRLEIDAHVRFHGHRSDSVACIKALDLLVICSDHEGLPMTSLEALATATPVVAHAVGGLNDVLANDAGGILVRDHSKAGYSDAIFRLLQSDASRFTTAGQSHLLARFSAETNAVRTLRLYRDELERDSVRKLR